MEMPNVGQGLSRKHIIGSVDASLKRMNTDYIDLYQSHRDDKDTRSKETLSTYGELIKAGKLRPSVRPTTIPRLCRGGQGRQGQGPAALREPATTLQSGRTPAVRGGARAGVPEAGNRRHPLLVAGQRVSDRQVPLGGRPRQKPARSGRREEST